MNEERQQQEEHHKLLAELLAKRDAEPFDPQTLQALSAEREAELINQARSLQNDLQHMDDVPVDASVWRVHIPAAKAPSPWLRFPLATAASIFLVSALGIFALFSGSQDSTTDANDFVIEGPDLNRQGAMLANLMIRSRDLEQQLHGMSGYVSAASSSEADTPEQDTSMSPEERVLLYRLADVDGQIGRLYEADRIDETARMALWNKRVDLLENLVVLRGARQGIQSIYMSDGRSL